MILEIMDNKINFDNRESEISKMFDYINKIIKDNNVFLESLEVDGMEIYEEFYEYFLENIEFIDLVKVNINTLKELIENTITSTLDYIVNAMPLVKNLSDLFKKSPTEKAWNQLEDLFSGISWIIESYNNIDQNSNLNELIDDYFIWNEYVVEIEKIKELLPEFLEALENKDTVLIGDILIYEITPILEVMADKLQKIAKMEVNIKNVN